MGKTILVCGYGPAISNAVAQRFGRGGFTVGLVGRTPERLQAGVAALTGAGIRAQAFERDLGHPEGVRALIREARAALGALDVLHWNAYARAAGDLTSAPASELRAVLDVAVHGLVAAVQEALDDLKAQRGAVLVTGGALSLYQPNIDAMAAEWNSMGLAVAKAAQHKLVGVLHQKLGRDGVYVGEATVAAIVRGSAFAGDHGTLAPEAVAEQLWKLYTERKEPYAMIS